MTRDSEKEGIKWIAYKDQERRETLTIALANQFAVPSPKGKTELELLQEAVGLAKDSDFQQKRAKMYDWQDDIIQKGITNKDALMEMSDYVNDYNAATKKAVRRVYTKLAFTLFPVAITAVAGPMTIPAAVGSATNLIRFWIFDRKPVVEAAAMFHTIYHQLGWRQASLSI